MKDFNKYKEKEILKEFEKYMETTYQEHYAGNSKSQMIDEVHDAGELLIWCKWASIKYLKRFGKKEGANKKDLFKAMHYIMFMLYDLGENNSKSKPPMDND